MEVSTFVQVVQDEVDGVNDAREVKEKGEEEVDAEVGAAAAFYCDTRVGKMKARMMATKRSTMSDILSVVDLLCESLLGFTCDDGSCGGLRVWFVHRYVRGRWIKNIIP
jgi:hypothetical protein